MVRFKHRYFLTEFHFEGQSDGRRAMSKLTPKSLRQELKATVKKLFGDYGLACIQNSLSVKYINESTQVCIIRCCREHHKTLWSTLTMMSSLSDVSCQLGVLHVAGTIRSCQKFLVGHNKRVLKEMIKNAKTQETRRQLQEVYLQTATEQPSLTT